MTKLTDTQLVILVAACQRADRLILPLPDTIKGGAATKVVESLAAKGMVEEAAAKQGEPIWRETSDGRRVTLIATDAALEALGITEDKQVEVAADAEEQNTISDTNASAEAHPAAEAEASTGPAAKRRAREDSKQAKLVEMLRRPDGATIEEIVAAFSWQPHTVRGAIAGALKKKLGLSVASDKVEGRGRVYRIAC